MQRLLNELSLLIKSSERYDIPITSTVTQLMADFDRVNGKIPRKPRLVSFTWPEDGIVDLRDYWNGK